MPCPRRHSAAWKHQRPRQSSARLRRQRHAQMLRHLQGHRRTYRRQRSRHRRAEAKAAAVPATLGAGQCRRPADVPPCASAQRASRMLHTRPSAPRTPPRALRALAETAPRHSTCTGPSLSGSRSCGETPARLPERRPRSRDTGRCGRRTRAACGEPLNARRGHWRRRRRRLPAAWAPRCRTRCNGRASLRRVCTRQCRTCRRAPCGSRCCGRNEPRATAGWQLGCPCDHNEGSRLRLSPVLAGHRRPPPCSRGRQQSVPHRGCWLRRRLLHHRRHRLLPCVPVLGGAQSKTRARGQLEQKTLQQSVQPAGCGSQWRQCAPRRALLLPLTSSPPAQVARGWESRDDRHCWQRCQRRCLWQQHHHHLTSQRRQHPPGPAAAATAGGVGELRAPCELASHGGQWHWLQGSRLHCCLQACQRCRLLPRPLSMLRLLSVATDRSPKAPRVFAPGAPAGMAHRLPRRPRLPPCAASRCCPRPRQCQCRSTCAAL